ncbi:hypothetical protein BGX26_004661 [Mortierella sp. AD094]|nr:hypothetical protein BGX26_004661 [Mortierella sp. AD094]
MFVLESRAAFRDVSWDNQTNQPITLPSLEQNPKFYGDGFQQDAFLVTQLMADMWHTLSADQQQNNHHLAKRIISGPVDVGKTYLALHLAARAYSEGWLMLYISDVSVLVQDSQEESSEEISLWELPWQQTRETLLVVDEHRTLFESEPSIPIKFPAIEIFDGSLRLGGFSGSG